MTTNEEVERYIEALAKGRMIISRTLCRIMVMLAVVAGLQIAVLVLLIRLLLK